VNTPFDANVALRRPPHLASSNDGTRTKNFTTGGAASTAELDLLGSDTIKSYVVLRFQQSGALPGTLIGYVGFGQTGMAAAVSGNDWAVYQGEIWEWLCTPADRYFRLIRSGAVDTTVQASLSDQPT
jgi:hypothetical protein